MSQVWYFLANILLKAEYSGAEHAGDAASRNVVGAVA
jgi:hypothetical protein